MQETELILEEYKIYSEMKEKFVDRNFTTNKFYLATVFVTLLAILFTKNLTLSFGFPSAAIFAIFGILICIMWWINVDSYDFLIRIKLREVLEKIEQKLPVNPNGMEFETITSFKNGKKEFLFADIQKLFATLMLILFILILANEIILHVFA